MKFTLIINNNNEQISFQLYDEPSRTGYLLLLKEVRTFNAKAFPLHPCNLFSGCLYSCSTDISRISRRLQT